MISKVEVGEKSHPPDGVRRQELFASTARGAKSHLPDELILMSFWHGLPATGFCNGMAKTLSTPLSSPAFATLICIA